MAPAGRFPPRGSAVLGRRHAPDRSGLLHAVHRVGDPAAGGGGAGGGIAPRDLPAGLPTEPDGGLVRPFPGPAAVRRRCAAPGGWQPRRAVRGAVRGRARAGRRRWVGPPDRGTRPPGSSPVCGALTALRVRLSVRRIRCRLSRGLLPLPGPRHNPAEGSSRRRAEEDAAPAVPPASGFQEQLPFLLPDLQESDTQVRYCAAAVGRLAFGRAARGCVRTRAEQLAGLRRSP